MSKNIYNIQLIFLLQVIYCLLPFHIYSQSNSNVLIQADNFEFKPFGLTFPEWEKKREGVLRFSIENKDQKIFNQLKVSEIKVILDGNKVNLPENALTLTESSPASVYILLDGSLSMLGSKKQGVNKLDAAKTAIIAFVSKLRKDDSVGIYAFDSEIYSVIEKTSNKETVTSKISSFSPRDGDSSLQTDLYGAIDKLLETSGKEKVQNIIVVSDGMQDTIESSNFPKTDFNEYKSQRETKILQNISKSGTRIFSVPIGDKNSLPKEPQNLNYVDEQTLCKIGDVATGGNCEYIDLPTLKIQSETKNIPYQTLLESKLTSTLEKIKNSFKFGYELKVPIEAQNLQGSVDSHKIEFYFPVVTSEQNKQPISQSEGKNGVEFKYDIKFLIPKPSSAIPNPVPRPDGIGIIGQPKFITFSTAIQPPSLLGIYLFTTASLGVLGLIPTFFNFLGRRRKQKEDFNVLNDAVLVVDENSPYGGTLCLSKDRIVIGEAIIICPNCGKPHHLDCWELNNYRCHNKNKCEDQLIIPQHLLNKYERV